MFKEGTVEKVSIHMLFSPKLFSTKSLRSGLDTCFHTKLSQGQEPGSRENLKIYDHDPERIFTRYGKVSKTD